MKVIAHVVIYREMFGVILVRVTQPGDKGSTQHPVNGKLNVMHLQNKALVSNRKELTSGGTLTNQPRKQAR